MAPANSWGSQVCPETTGKTVGGTARDATDESLVDLRCSVVVHRADDVLVISRGGPDGDWVLPGGRPRDGESMHACARREAFEETGLRVTPGRCIFVGEVIDPHDRTRIVELIFLAQLDAETPRPTLVGEPGTDPQWVSLPRLRSLHLRPPVAGYLAGVGAASRTGAAYIGNLWRPAPGARLAGADPSARHDADGAGPPEHGPDER